MILKAARRYGNLRGGRNAVVRRACGKVSIGSRANGPCGDNFIRLMDSTYPARGCAVSSTSPGL